MFRILPKIRWQRQDMYKIKETYQPEHSMHDGFVVHCHPMSVNVKLAPVVSSTEAGLIDINDVAGQILWTHNFLIEQGYSVGASMVHQDNKSAMLLSSNGILSSSKQTKHINVRHYFIKDRIEKGEINIVFCPTSNMTTNYFTKPLQCSQFVRFRDVIIGTTCFNSLSKECVAET